MKNILVNSLTLICIILFASCSGGSGPEQTTRNFLELMNAGDFEAAKEYATTDTKSMLSMMESFGVKDQLADMTDDDKGSFEIISTTIDGDTAVCKINSGEEGEDGMDIRLVKKDGKWLVDMDKESMNKEGLDDMDKETGNPAFNFDTEEN